MTIYCLGGHYFFICNLYAKVQIINNIAKPIVSPLDVLPLYPQSVIRFLCFCQIILSNF